MNITYIIGNGFDRALGLHTDYPSFIKAYVDEKIAQVREGTLDNDDPLMKMCADMKEDPKTWADAERAFGLLKFSTMGRNAISVYDTCYDDLVGSFYKRILAENDRFLSGNEISEAQRASFLNALVRIDKHMPIGRHPAYFEYLCNNGEVAVNFINFNYTETLERILGVKTGDVWEVKMPQNRLLRVKLGRVCHVHGSFKTNDIVFGVDNKMQIADEKVRNYCNRVGGLLKAKVDENTRAGNESLAQEILKGAQLIVLYGVSCGETDMAWWQRVYKRIISGRSKLVVCPYREKQVFAMNAKKKCDIAAQSIRDVFKSILKVESGAEDWLTFPDPSLTAALDTFRDPDGKGKFRYCDYFGLGKIGDSVLRRHN